MTGQSYPEFIREAQALQHAYIRDERRRYRRAQRLRTQYETAMRAIGLHPLDYSEIVRRLCDLDDMRREVPTTHGDSALMRFAFQRHQAGSQVAPAHGQHFEAGAQ